MKLGQILRLTPKIVSQLKFAILNISKRSCYKNYQDNRFSCHHCNRNFKHNWSLNLHERIHTGIKPSTCQFCNKYFPYAKDATVHERIHPAEKPFFCNSKFISSTKLNRYNLVHSDKRNIHNY